MTTARNLLSALIICFSGLFTMTNAQVAWLYPLNPGTEEEITLTYNTNTGNLALAGYEGNIYLTHRCYY